MLWFIIMGIDREEVKSGKEVYIKLNMGMLFFIVSFLLLSSSSLNSSKQSLFKYLRNTLWKIIPVLNSSHSSRLSQGGKKEHWASAVVMEWSFSFGRGTSQSAWLLSNPIIKAELFFFKCSAGETAKDNGLNDVLSKISCVTE